MSSFDLVIRPKMQRGRKAALLLASMLFLTHATWSPATAQTLQEMKDAMEMMVGSAAICSSYLKRPEVLEDTRQLAREQLGKVGMSASEADAFSDGIVTAAMSETNTEMQQQVACEIINIPAIK